MNAMTDARETSAQVIWQILCKIPQCLVFLYILYENARYDRDSNPEYLNILSEKERKQVGVTDACGCMWVYLTYL